tara:strand:+ start:2794 stop:4314 length:1521 start_codon:yes stop_codon:yes gene_type:complete
MPTLNNYFYKSTICLGFISVLLGAAPVQAQNCNAPYEMMTELRYPELGSYSVWDNAYGEPRKSEIFKSAIALDDGTVLAVGEKRHLEKVAPSLMIVKFDKRGRKSWEEYHSPGQIKDIVKFIPFQKGYVILVNRYAKDENRKDYASLFFIDNNAKITKVQNIQSDAYNITATDVLGLNDAADTIVISAIHSRSEGQGEDQRSIKRGAIYTYNKNKNATNWREYIVGINSEILSLEKTLIKGGAIDIIATGTFENNHGKKMGWVFRLDKDGSYKWQKEFSRGESTLVSDAYGYKNGDIIAAGTVKPIGERPNGAWLMRLDGNNGDIKWQRYYYGEKSQYHYSAQDVVVNDDGIITFLMSAISYNEIEERGFDGSGFGHVLNISPRGITLGGEAYFKGNSAHINEMRLAPKSQYIMSGYTWQNAQKVFEEFKEGKDKNNPTPVLPEAEISQKSQKGLDLLKGKVEADHVIKDRLNSDNNALKKNGKEQDQNAWVMIGTAFDTYTDPCD